MNENDCCDDLDLDSAERRVRSTIATHGALDALGYALRAISELRSAREELSARRPEDGAVVFSRAELRAARTLIHGIHIGWMCAAFHDASAGETIYSCEEWSRTCEGFGLDPDATLAKFVDAFREREQ